MVLSWFGSWKGGPLPERRRHLAVHSDPVLALVLFPGKTQEAVREFQLLENQAFGVSHV